MTTETVRINGLTYDIPAEVATYMQYQEDTIKELRRSHQKQETDWAKAFDILNKRHAKQLAYHSPEKL